MNLKPETLPAAITMIATVRYDNGMQTTSRATWEVDKDNARHVALLCKYLVYIIGTGWVLHATLPAPQDADSLYDLHSVNWIIESDQSPDADYAFEPAWVLDAMCAAYETAERALHDRRKIAARVMAEKAIDAIAAQLTYIRDGRTTGYTPFADESPDWLLQSFPYTASLMHSACALGDMILEGWARYGDGEDYPDPY